MINEHLPDLIKGSNKSSASIVLLVGIEQSIKTFIYISLND